MASEMTKMTQEQILQQAGTSMLAQANAAAPDGAQAAPGLIWQPASGQGR